MPGSVVEQLSIAAWVPSAVLPLGSARQPDPGFSSIVPPGWATHFCSVVLLQADMTILVPSAVAFPLSSRHLPGIPDTIGPAGSSHSWLALPWQRSEEHTSELQSRG